MKFTVSIMAESCTVREISDRLLTEGRRQFAIKWRADEFRMLLAVKSDFLTGKTVQQSTEHHLP